MELIFCGKWLVASVSNDLLLLATVICPPANPPTYFPRPPKEHNPMSKQKPFLPFAISVMLFLLFTFTIAPEVSASDMEDADAGSIAASLMPQACTFIPNDPYYHTPPFLYAPEQINAPGAWCYTQGDPDIVVAVLSTGIDMDHPEFAGRIVPGYDFANDDDDPSDDHGIGTHEAGIIAAGIDNGIGIAGIAGNVKIMPVKVLSMMGSPPAPIGSFSDVADGIVWAVDQGAQILYLGPQAQVSQSEYEKL